MNPYTLTEARSLALQVCQKMRLDPQSTAAVLEAVKRAPKRAAIAYRAILNTYVCPKCERPL